MNIFKHILEHVSPSFRKSILSVLDNLKSDASKTNNPWDDVAVMFLFMILGFSYDK